MEDPQVTMGFNTQLVIHDLDDARWYPHDLGHLHMEINASTSSSIA